MQEQEIITIPCERVAIDLVGPFPVQIPPDIPEHGVQVASCRNTTTRILIDQLTLIFSRCSFPTIIVSDNRPQFVANSFHKWLKEKGITQVRESPYHPQSNGVVEQMH